MNFELTPLALLVCILNVQGSVVKLHIEKYSEMSRFTDKEFTYDAMYRPFDCC